MCTDFQAENTADDLYLSKYGNDNFYRQLLF